MKISKSEYAKLVKKYSPPSPKTRDFLAAFFVGGFICTLGQVLFNVYSMWNMGELNARALVSASLIFLAALFTGIGWFDDIARFAGAGTLVPITGFANAMVSPAIEYKKEGQVLGIGANMFKIAGPVIVFGITASAVYGLILWIIKML